MSFERETISLLWANTLSNGTLTCHITLMHFPRIIHYDLSLERRKLELLYLVLLIG